MTAKDKPSSAHDQVTGLTLFPALTDRQLEVLQFVFEKVKTERIYPTQREICNAFGYHQAAAQQFLNALIKKGYLVKDSSIARRNIRLTSLAAEKIDAVNKLAPFEPSSKD